MSRSAKLHRLANRPGNRGKGVAVYDAPATRRPLAALQRPVVFAIVLYFVFIFLAMLFLWLLADGLRDAQRHGHAANLPAAPRAVDGVLPPPPAFTS